MTHNYYHEDYEANHSQRLRYFDVQFLEGLKKQANAQGISLSFLLSQIIDIDSFKKLLEISFSFDSSLSSYFSGMDNTDISLFFNRPKIQQIVRQNIQEEAISQQFIQKKLQIPIKVVQVKKKTREYFSGRIKQKRTIGYRDYVNVKGKRQVRYRDKKGRFISIK